MNIAQKNKSLALPTKNSQMELSKYNLANHKKLFEKAVAKETSDWEVRELLMGLYKRKVNKKNIHLYYMHPIRTFLEHISNGTLSELTKYSSVETRESIKQTKERKRNEGSGK